MERGKISRISLPSSSRSPSPRTMGSQSSSGFLIERRAMLGATAAADGLE